MFTLGNLTNLFISHRRYDNELYANPKSILTCMGPTGEDCISLCSNFRYGLGASIYYVANFLKILTPPPLS